VAAIRPYLRFPDLRGDQLAFVADDDVWLVTLAGGRATRLTADRAPAARPRQSPDGNQLAWTSRRDGAPEVYVVSLAGGAPRRLSYWGHRTTKTLGWVDDETVIAATAAGQPFRFRTWAHALPSGGGPVRRLPFGPVANLTRPTVGRPQVLQAAVISEPPNWKRYRGGTAAKLWIETGPDHFERFLAELDGQVSDPMWLGDRLLFCSDHEGHGNVYSVDARGGDLRRHTDHTGPYARHLTADGSVAVYQYAGDLWRIDSLARDSEPARLDIGLPGARSSRAATVIDATASVGEFAVDGGGRATLAEIRGTVQWVTHLDGPVRALADAAGVRTRLPRVVSTPTGHRAVWVTDADADDALEYVDVPDDAPGPEEPRRVLAGQLGRVLDLAVAADGEQVAVATHDGRVLVVSLLDASVRELAHHDSGDASGLTFSPDSRWLAWSAPDVDPLRHIVIAATDGSAVVDATRARFIDTEPTFTRDGRHLAFLSARTFDPVYDAHNFELSFPVGIRPYLIPLAASTPSPFDPELGGRALAGSEPPPGGSSTLPGDSTDQPTDDVGPTDAAPGPERLHVDLDGMADRVVAVPTAAGLLSGLQAAKGGLLWIDQPLQGEIGADRPAGAKRRRARLQRWDFGKRSVSDLADEVVGFAVSGDGTRIVVQDDDGLRVGPSDHRVDDPAPGEVVDIDLARVRVVIDPVAQWQQMTGETWRLMRDHFWSADMAGVDWPAALDVYRPLVDRISTRDDLSEVLWEMIAELGTSHAYERPPVPGPPAGRAAAFLGADLERDADGRWVIARVLPGEASIPAARSPLAAAGVAITAGTVLVAVNGHPIGPEGPAPLIAGLADRPVALTVAGSGVERTVAVVPTADETPLRYQDWIAGRRAFVHERTAGKVGYLHVPDMVSTGWAEFNRDLRTEVRRDALVVDTRENEGGHTSQLVLERLSRRVLGWEKGRHLSSGTYPSDAPRGPLVAVANEMTGSDGDIVNQAFRELGLGPIVGVRTWGGVVGIDGRYDLVDGTVVTQPRYPFWFVQMGWGVENHGVDPDVEVPRPPQDWVTDVDRQLERAVDLAVAATATFATVAMPDLATRPDKSAPALGPRP
jgi:tricorn protease